jgi:hypothetical protein
MAFCMGATGHHRREDAMSERKRPTWQYDITYRSSMTDKEILMEDVGSYKRAIEVAKDIVIIENATDVAIWVILK